METTITFNSNEELEQEIAMLETWREPIVDWTTNTITFKSSAYDLKDVEWEGTPPMFERSDF